MRKTVRRLPSELMRTITWGQGREMDAHGTFTVATGVQVYFCDPNSPWQRATNENTNGLLRQYLPKSTDLSGLSRADLDVIARSLKSRPRKRLGYMKPSERSRSDLVIGVSGCAIDVRCGWRRERTVVLARDLSAGWPPWHYPGAGAHFKQRPQVEPNEWSMSGV
jgi:hypothetical protein